jgi:tryptophan synthase alpha chain
MSPAGDCVQPDTRIKRTFARLKEQNRKALVSFITAGDPEPEFTVPGLHALVAGGADLLELGIPFSDPEAEGPIIQAANERALAQGITLAKVLKMVETFREHDVQTPVVLMGYLNSVLAMEGFAKKASTAGVDGLIMVNLPPEEGDTLQRELAENNMDLIYLIAPTTTDLRAKEIIAKASGFIYYVSLKGITGSGKLRTDEVAIRTSKLRQITGLPVCVGFGIRDAQTAAALSQQADGVVVGSALVEQMSTGENAYAASQILKQTIANIRQGLDQ